MTTKQIKCIARVVTNSEKAYDQCGDLYYKITEVLVRKDAGGKICVIYERGNNTFTSVILDREGHVVSNLSSICKLRVEDQLV